MSSLLAVVVLYKRQPAESPTLQTLFQAVSHASPTQLRLKIVVWDNTPGGQAIDELPSGVEYIAAPENPGLAVAYNYVLAMAEAEGYEWLLTLDQDSSLPADFLERIAELLRKTEPVRSIGAIVPEVIADGRTISPFYFLFGALPRFFRPGFRGVWNGAVYAANSGSVLRVSAVREIGGYDPMFPLDLSDTSLFHRLHASGRRVYVASELSMQHDFALLNKQDRMSVERYDASLLDDCAFWDIYMSPLARLERVVRFSVRAIKELFTPGAAAFRRRTMLEVRRRLLTPRKRRIARWRAWAKQRLEASAGSLYTGDAAKEVVRAGLPRDLTT